MKEITPGKSIGALRLGGNLSEAREVFGEGDYTSNPLNPDFPERLEYSLIGLSLSFGPNGQLEFACIEGESAHFSLLGTPLPILFPSEDSRFGTVRAWLEERSATFEEPKWDSFGCYDLKAWGGLVHFVRAEDGSKGVQLLRKV